MAMATIRVMILDITYIIVSTGFVLFQISSLSYAISAERKQRIAENPEVTTRSVYVQGLAWSTTNEGLAAYFSTAGNIVNANVLYRTRGGKMGMDEKLL